MKTLLFMRHAKSSWAEPSQSDIERPLNRRGQRDAPRMGRWLVSNSWVPELIVVSSATRTQETAELLVGEFDRQPEIMVESRLYNAPPQVYLELIPQLSDEYSTVMMLGHNPSMEALVEASLAQPTQVPTGAIAALPLNSESWRELVGDKLFEAVDLDRATFCRPKSLQEEEDYGW